jgi:O-antigen/teichoic acid export membrane protein
MKIKIIKPIPFLASNTIIYSIGLFLANAITFINYPILARGLSTNNFGIYDLFSSFAILLSILMTFGIDSSVGRYFHEYDDNLKRNKVVFEGLVVQLAIIIIVCSLFYSIAEKLISYVSEDENLVILLRLTIIQSAFQAILNFTLSLLKWTFEKWKFIFLSIITSGLGLGLTSIAVYGFNADLNVVFESIVVGRAISAVLAVYLIRNWLADKKITFEYTLLLIRYSIPIGFICVIEVIIPTFERNSILGIVNAEQLGLYAAAAKMVAILTVFVQGFQAAWGPLSLSIRNIDKADEIYSLTAKVFVIAICLSVILITFSGKLFLGILLSQRYEDAYILIFPMSMSLAIQSTGLITGLGIYISKSSYYQIVNYVVFAVSSIVLIITLTKIYGIVGTAIAVLLSSIIKTITSSILGQYLYPIKWPIRVICLIFFITTIIGIVLIFIQIHCEQWVSGIYTLITVIAMIYFFFFYSLSSDERVRFSEILRNATKFN